MPSSPLPSPSPAATTSPPAPPPTTPEASKEAKKTVRLLLNLPLLHCLIPFPLVVSHFSHPHLMGLTLPKYTCSPPHQASLHAKISALSAQIAATQAQIDAIKPQLKSPSPETTVKQHIALLHTYNEIRDVGQGLLGMVAENRGVRIRDVYGEFGVAEGD
ncbi:hypothetical protein MMC27_004509 [Xylographa pallens]|nr:hypothetical protein [Xylographa pallens]